MLNFSTEQRILELGDIRLGGQPGELPTVLFGTAFYGKKFKSMDPEAVDEARKLIRAQEEMSQLTGNPAVVDVYLGDSETVAG
ncbi:MAG: tetrahydromethanopterin S-methyltransferase subunit H, partial [Candidatus Thermoplasmatota archaeon]|nr:tetrahydromethanopterin S-methyltransferase subunit H [Candidatus Thermoplasmatota archaeon]